MEPATLTYAVAMLLFTEVLKAGNKVDKNALALAAKMIHVEQQQ